MAYKYWYLYDENATIKQAQLASLGVYDVWCWFQTQLARYYFRAGDGSETNVFVVPIRPVSIEVIEEEAKALGDFLASIVGDQKANEYLNNLQRTTFTLWQLGQNLFVIPDHWSPDNDASANLQVPGLVSKMELTTDDLTTIAASAQRYLMTGLRIPVANVFPVTSSPATIVAIPREDVDQGSYYEEFVYEMNLLLDEMYRANIVDRRLSVLDGRFVEATEIKDVLLRAGVILEGTLEAAQQSSQGSGSSGSSG